MRRSSTWHWTDLVINKRINPSTWTVAFTSNDIIILSVLNPLGRRMHVINIYDELGAGALLQADKAIRSDFVLMSFGIHRGLISRKILIVSAMWESTATDSKFPLIVCFCLAYIHPLKKRQHGSTRLQHLRVLRKALNTPSEN